VKFEARALPIPTAWLPCPGNTKAIAMPYPSICAEIAPKDTAIAVMSSQCGSPCFILHFCKNGL
jgi:hypothetical protein